MMDNTNHNLIHTLSVRLDASWHDSSYREEVACEGCQRTFDRLRAIDEEAVGLLSAELSAHIHDNKFPIDLTD